MTSPPFTLPPAIAARIGRAVLQPVDEHWSDAEVFRVVEADAYLKVTPPGALHPLRAEHERLCWLDGRVPAPPWWMFAASEDGREFLLTAALAPARLSERASELGPRMVVRIL